MKSVRVLLVENSEEMTEAVTEVLRTAAMEIYSVSNADLAMNILDSQWKFEVILLDFWSKPKHEIAFLSWLALSPHKDLPVVVMTADPYFKCDEFDLNLSLLLKPFGLDGLIGAVLAAADVRKK